MTIVRRPSPLGELVSLGGRRWTGSSRTASFRPRHGDRPAALGLPLDITNTDALVVEASLPGIRPEDVEITVEDGTLTIRGRVAASGRRGG
jgi:HSP20 family protein